MFTYRARGHAYYVYMDVCHSQIIPEARKLSTFSEAVCGIGQSLELARHRIMLACTHTRVAHIIWYLHVLRRGILKHIYVLCGANGPSEADDISAVRFVAPNNA